MIIDIKSKKTIRKIPHPDVFETIRTRLSPSEFKGVVGEINEKIDNAGGEIATAGWLPGPDWSNTPFQCIYETAAKRHQEVAGKMFGLMVWHTVMERPERWSFGRYKIGDLEIRSITYFRLGDSAGAASRRHREKPKSLFGIDRGRFTIVGDIVGPLDVEWEANVEPGQRQ